MQASPAAQQTGMAAQRAVPLRLLRVLLLLLPLLLVLATQVLDQWQLELSSLAGCLLRCQPGVPWQRVSCQACWLEPLSPT
jgi:hypothetical protein